MKVTWLWDRVSSFRWFEVSGAQFAKGLKLDTCGLSSIHGSPNANANPAPHQSPRSGMSDDIRPGEKTVAMPEPRDAALIFIGRIETPWTARGDCPRQGTLDGPLCKVVLDPLWREALEGIDAFRELQLLYWMDQARRDLVRLAPSSHGTISGPFALRAPVRPNPIASSIVTLEERQDHVLLVRGLDCINGTPLVDIKPHRSRR